MKEIKSYAIYSDQGPHLNLNEDLVDADLDLKLFTLIDGFGGSNIGDRIAALAKDAIKRSYTKISVDPDSTLPFYFSHKYTIEGNALINAFTGAHNLVNKENESRSINKKGGASAMVAAVSDEIVTFVSTGNCKLYLYRQGHLQTLIIPDSLFTFARNGFDHHLLSSPVSALGLFEDFHYQVKEHKISNGDLLIFLTDGIYSRLSNAEVKFHVEKHLDDEMDIILSLSKLANDRGNLDNQSGVVLQF